MLGTSGSYEMCVYKINWRHVSGGRFIKSDTEAALGRLLGARWAKRISKTTLQAEGAARAKTGKAVV